MATYASATNPFLKPNKLPDEHDGSAKKSAPGMARPMTLKDETVSPPDDSIETNFMSNIDLVADEPIQGVTDRELVRVNLNSSDKILTDNIPQNNDEVTDAKTVVDLITPTESLSLDNGVKVESEISSSTTPVTKDLNDDDDDEVDADMEQENEIAPSDTNSRHHQHIELIKKLRLQLRDLEKYAYERGELDEVPASVQNERQTVIIETLRDRLSLNIGLGSLEKLNIDELKKQIDKEISDQIDPLVTKEHLLGQLKTQLTDLERYIAHLHGTISKIHKKRNCSCELHGCSSDNHHLADASSVVSEGHNVMDSDSISKTSRLIRSLLTQLVCSDMKIQESAKKAQVLEKSENRDIGVGSIITKQPQVQDNAAWSLHIDNVILATDSLVNLYQLEPQYRRYDGKSSDERLVSSVVRRQLVPALRDILSYGLIDPNTISQSTSYAALLFDPYHLLSSLTCFPGSRKSEEPVDFSKLDKIHVWNVIEDYYRSRIEPGFKISSVKTLSQSFNLEPTIDGPIKVTSKQALLIAVDDIVETLSRCKPNGPESHFNAFIYTALNRSKLNTWLRLVFKNKSILRKYYHDFSFVSQTDKIEKLLKTIDPLNQLEFKLSVDVESIEQFVSAF